MSDSAYLVSVDITSLRVLVVGGGRVAARKVGAFPASPMSLRVVAPDIRSELETMISNSTGNVEVLRREFRSSDIDGSGLVFAATSDLEVNAEVARLAVERGVLVNNVSDSSRSSFSNVATVNKGGLSVGVSSNPKVPGFSKAIGRLIEDVLPAEVDRLLVLAADVRSKALSSGHTEGGLDWTKVLNSNIFEYIRSGELALAEESIAECLS